MKFIANIYCKGKVESFSQYVNIVNDPTLLDFSIPTLIVGWDETKNLFPGANILDKEVSEGVFWTFPKNVRRNEYERDFTSFKRYVIKSVLKKIRYQYFDFAIEPYSHVKPVLNLLKKGGNIIMISYDMAYLLYKDKVIGFSLKESDYLGIKRKKVLDYISKNQIIYSNEFLNEEDKKTFQGNNIIVPYLYSLNI